MPIGVDENGAKKQKSEKIFSQQLSRYRRFLPLVTAAITHINERGNKVNLDA